MAKGPGKIESERQIKEVIKNSDFLKHRNIKVFLQGSYRNRVDVGKESDVDIGVMYYDTMFIDSLGKI